MSGLSGDLRSTLSSHTMVLVCQYHMSWPSTIKQLLYYCMMERLGPNDPNIQSLPCNICTSSSFYNQSFGGCPGQSSNGIWVLLGPQSGPKGFIYRGLYTPPCIPQESKWIPSRPFSGCFTTQFCSPSPSQSKRNPCRIQAESKICLDQSSWIPGLCTWTIVLWNLNSLSTPKTLTVVTIIITIK
jgi:hypothetical protein